MTQQPHELVWTLTTAGFAARCVHVVADLGVADRIDDSRASADELASACGVDADALGRVMSLLAAHGIFDHRDGTFGHTVSSRLLRSDHPMTMRPFLQMMGLPIIRAASPNSDTPSAPAGRPLKYWNRRAFGHICRVTRAMGRYSGEP